MTDRMRVLPFASLLGWALSEFEQDGSIFGKPLSVASMKAELVSLVLNALTEEQ